MNKHVRHIVAACTAMAVFIAAERKEKKAAIAASLYWHEGVRTYDRLVYEAQSSCETLIRWVSHLIWLLQPRTASQLIVKQLELYRLLFIAMDIIILFYHRWCIHSWWARQTMNIDNSFINIAPRN